MKNTENAFRSQACGHAARSTALLIVRYYRVMPLTRFPQGFLWGAATSSYQIEGSPLADGASPSIWHEFAHRRGTVKDGSTADTACDHYNRVPSDIALMRELGLSAYRFSVSWPRIIPSPGILNQRGIDFYSRLVDGLLAAGIRPFATVFHWDAPQWLEGEGGFTGRACVDRLVEYGTALFRALGDRVKSWITVNEPSVFALGGWVSGNFPPGRRNNLRGFFHAAHHLLLAHARLVDACASLVPGGQAGLAHHFIHASPRDPGRPRDRDAAAFMDELANGFYLDALYRGAYPARVVSRMGRFLPRGFASDLPDMRRPGGFIGMNYYGEHTYRHTRLQPYVHAAEHVDPRVPRTENGIIAPAGLHAQLMRLRDTYGNPPCYITENGRPLPDRAGTEPLDDGERINYLAVHLESAARAAAEGADCRGYFHWSLMDNFEWDKGLAPRWGFARVDFATQTREWKKSASWYREVIRGNALPAERDRDNG
jgi:beta-glucosidase